MKLTTEQLSGMGYTEKSQGIWVKDGKVVMRAPQSIPKAPQSDSVVQKVSEHPKSPEDRLNKTEREFLGRLRMGVYGDMKHIGVQSITLQLGFDCRYTPDFWTVTKAGEMLIWECKGFMRDDARVKLYAAARAFPFWVFYLVSKSKTINGEWNHKLVHQ